MSAQDSLRRELRRIRPWAAAATNFMFPGLGYILNRRRVLLGFALCTFFFTLLFGSSFVATAPDPASRAATLDTFILVVVCAWLGLSATLARDAFQDARKKAREQEAGAAPQVK